LKLLDFEEYDLENPYVYWIFGIFLPCWFTDTDINKCIFNCKDGSFSEIAKML